MLDKCTIKKTPVVYPYNDFNYSIEIYSQETDITEFFMVQLNEYLQLESNLETLDYLINLADLGRIPYQEFYNRNFTMLELLQNHLNSKEFYDYCCIINVKLSSLFPNYRERWSCIN